MKRTTLMRRTPLKAGAARLKVRRRKAVGTVDERLAFRLVVCHPAAVCAVVDDGPCDGQLESHHVVPQQWLRKRWDGAMLALVLWDPQNGMALCERHHRRHTNAVRRVPLAALTPAHCEFIHMVDADVHVERTYRKKETK
jgi:hypothetical protein